MLPLSQEVIGSFSQALKSMDDNSFYNAGNSGIGFETSLRLALNSARIYIAARSRKSVDEAITKMRESCKQQLDLHFLELDLQSLESVKTAAAEFLKQESRLDLLINNAGVSIPCGYPRAVLGTRCVKTLS